jgi:polyisoprenoid-binding protein YceI
MTNPSSAATHAIPAPGSYRLDPAQSTVRVHGKGMFGLLPVHGTVRLLSGEVTITEDPAQSSVQATIEAASYSSGLAKRDQDVTSASLLDAATYPEITFSGVGARPHGSGWVVPGTVTAHGTSVPTELRIENVRSEDGTARFRAVAELDRTQFGITQKKGMVGRKVAVIVDAVAVPA